MSPPSEKHRRYRDPRKVQRRQDFKTLCAILERLEKRRSRPVFGTAEELDDLLVVCGAPFNIDDEDPIDVEPRYFRPGPVDKMNQGLQAEGEEMPQLDVIEAHKLGEQESARLDRFAYDALGDAWRRGEYCESAAWTSTYWQRHRYVKERNQPGGCEGPYDGRFAPYYHYFTGASYRMWPRGEEPKNWIYHPDVPHAIGTVYDCMCPRDGSILRSELLFAVSLLKASVRDANMFIDHQVCPILIGSFHGRFSARIMQAYLQNGRMVVRPSRLLNFHTRVASYDVKLMIRWLNCSPVGDTRWASFDLSLPKDRGATEVEFDRDNPPTHAISVL
ncbi:Uncharacterized protein TPAR_07793 [Tolypocladium paradoxum]|uniref:Uncharacterized protein n=1 Tax=Tolypocladium paradoxum TaxID=94208 RepID=A0A2S4KP75_9HYPO|nr:Uncharacterized protein TPAR_07793 [Tolypocladium paradoxum]